MTTSLLTKPARRSGTEFRPRHGIQGLAGVLILTLLVPPAAAQQPAPADAAGVPVLARYSDEHAALIVSGNVESASTRTALASSGLLIPPLPNRQLTQLSLTGLVDYLQSAGVGTVHAVYSLSDRPVDMPYLVLENVSGQTVEQFRKDRQALGLRWTVYQDGEHVVLGTPGTVQRLKYMEEPAKESVERLREVYRSLEGFETRAMVQLADDYQRALEELQPTVLIGESKIPVRVLTRGVNWIAIGLNGPPDTAGRLVVDTSGDLQQVQNVFEDAIKANQKSGNPAMKLAADLLATVPLNQQGRQLRYDLAGEPVTAQFEAAYKKMLGNAASESDRIASLDQLRHLGLALHNYYDTHKRFPLVQPGDSKNLGWRVHLLPYLDFALYQEFRLDEPWDSEHNRKLIPRMPAIFRAPHSTSDRAAGLSNYVLPVASAPAGDGEPTVGVPVGEPLSIRQITDGTSNTIMILQVDDQHAQVWTRPGGHPIDRDMPAQGLTGVGAKEGYLAAMFDGAVQVIPKQVPAEVLLKLFTLDGAEPVNPSQLQ